MSETTQGESDLELQEQQEREDAARLCAAFALTLKHLKITPPEVARFTHTSESAVRRMMTYQEPKLSYLARFERVYGLTLGTVAVAAELITLDDTPEALLAIDSRLHPVYQRSGPAMVQTWIALSQDEFDRS